MKSDNNSIQRNYPITNYFIYGGKEFPFNINLFNLSSDYFKSNHQNIQQNEKINLLDESEGNIHLSDESISDFIDFCQNKNIILKDENIPSLHKLSKKYMVTDLIEHTESHILSQPDKFIIQFLSLVQDRQDLNTDQYEDTISTHLPDYIQDDKLLSLPFTTLYRIVTKYQLKPDLSNKNKFIEFLFKCLDKYGRKASALFEKVDFMQEDAIYLRKLNDEYSEIFDFHFISSANHKNMYEIQSEIIQKEIQINLQKEQITTLIHDENTQMRSEINEIKQKQEEMNNSNQTMMNQMTENFMQQFNDLKEQVRQMTEMMNQQNNLILQLKEQINVLRKPRISCYFKGESNPKGIVNFLSQSLKLSAGGRNNSSTPLTNILSNNDNTFENYSNGSYKTNKKDDSWIEFDFGPSTKVDLHSYFIRSNGSCVSYWYHPKSWRIEGSNDKNDWILLDKRENEGVLNGPNKQSEFQCHENKFGKENHRFRYIRYFQDDCWYEKMGEMYQNPYNIYIKYIELYGDIYQSE